MKLVDNWKKLWRAFSVQAMALSSSILTAWAVIPEKYQSMVPTNWVLGGVAVVLFLGIVGRFIDQPKTK